ncbi:hypothetical protein I3760_05G156400 [Carya illinoinensis]|nr:hypothetical protein I3760_05G156400 [Carya illinoinensis]
MFSSPLKIERQILCGTHAWNKEKKNCFGSTSTHGNYISTIMQWTLQQEKKRLTFSCAEDGLTGCHIAGFGEIRGVIHGRSAQEKRELW